MALFSRKKKQEETSVAAANAVSTPASTAVNANVAHILRNPRITEKATFAAQMGIYVFDVSEDANKKTVAAAVAQHYKVTPRMVRIVTIPAKAMRNARTGQRGMKQGGKKAYVYLKKGETLTIM